MLEATYLDVRSQLARPLLVSCRHQDQLRQTAFSFGGSCPCKSAGIFCQRSHSHLEGKINAKKKRNGAL